MPFDPNKPFEVLDEKPQEIQSGFDPNQPFEVLDDKPEEEPSTLASAAEGTGDFFQSLKENIPGYGLAERAAAGVGALGRQGMELFGKEFEEGKDKTFSQHYEDIRAEDEAKKAVRRERSPIASTVGLVGAAVVPGGQAGALTRAGMNIGLSAADVATRQDSLEDAAKAGLGAGATTALIEAAFGAGGKLVKGVSKSLAPEKMAVKAIGADKKLLKQQSSEFGQELLDEGIVKFGDTLNSINERAKKIVEKQGPEISTALKKLDKSGARIQGNDILKGWQDRLGELKADPVFSSEAKKLDKLIDKYKPQLEDKEVTFTLVQKFKQNLDKKITNWDKTKPGFQKELISMRNHIRDTIDDAAAKADPFLARGYQDVRNQYRLAKQVLDTTEDKLKAKDANKLFGSTDSMLGAASFIEPTALLGLGAKKGLEKYGPAATAATIDTVKKVLESSPQSLGKYSKLLKDAAAKSNKSLVLIHTYLMQNDPEYQQTTQSLQ